MDISPTALFSYLSDDLQASGFDISSLKLDVNDYWPGANAHDVSCLRLARSFFKKLNDDTSPDADEKCLRKFMASDELCHKWSYDPQSTKDEVLFGLLKQEIDNFLHPMGVPLINSYFDLINRGRAGPGASLGANGVDFYTKFFSSKLTATSFDLYKLYNEYVCWFPDWVEAELSRSLNLGTVDIIQGNRLSFVRKTRDISRSICTEPSLNMFFQLGLGEIIADRLSSFSGIDIPIQAERNRAMARRGSLDESVCTIDLESASDSVSINLLRQILPGWFFDILMDLRSPQVDLGGVWHELSMISSMGNGFTFPLQTMIFSCVVRAVAKFQDFNLLIPGNVGTSDLRRVPVDFDAVCKLREETLWGVFGDDIICPSGLGDNVVNLLSLCGFRVNRSKSYFVGPFRESCGGDYYRGHLVRGVYIRSLLTPQDRYVAINRLNEWSAVSGVNLPRTVGYLCDSVRNLAVPYFEADTAGIRTMRPPGNTYKSSKQRYYYRVYEPVVRELLVTSNSVSPAPNYWGEPPKRRIFNPSGLFLSFLAGYIRNCRITVALKQGGKMRYRMRTKVAPYWGSFRPGSAFAAGSAFWMSRVTEALDSNLNS